MGPPPPRFGAADLRRVSSKQRRFIRNVPLTTGKITGEPLNPSPLETAATGSLPEEALRRARHRGLRRGQLRPRGGVPRGVLSRRSRLQRHARCECGTEEREVVSGRLIPPPRARDRPVCLPVEDGDKRAANAFQVFSPFFSFSFCIGPSPLVFPVVVTVEVLGVRTGKAREVGGSLLRVVPMSRRLLLASTSCLHRHHPEIVQILACRFPRNENAILSPQHLGKMMLEP